MLLRARPLGLIASAASLAAGLIAAVAPSVVAAQASPQTAQSDPYSPAYGHPYRHGVVPTVGQARRMKAYEATHATTSALANTNTLAYGGGIDNIGVTSGTPQVYLVFWGSQWGTQSTDGNGDDTFSKDPSGGAPYVQELFKGLGTGNETWSGTMTQYCDGPLVAFGATKCPPGAAFVGYPKGGALAGVWYDNGSAEPVPSTAHQLAVEAVRAAGQFGNTTAASNRYAQYIILSAHNTNPDNWLNSQFCAWHDYNGDVTLDGGGAAPSPYGDIAFTNMPYVMDAGFACGQASVNNPGTLDGYSIVVGHEYAETITDQNPAGGWSNPNSGNENGDDCGFTTNAVDSDVTLATGSFAMQPTWSNDTNQCAISHPLYSAMTVVSGSSQSAVVGNAFSNQLQLNVSNSNGPVSGLAVILTAPSSGASVTFGSPCSGTKCTVTTDASGNTTAVTVTANSKSGAFNITTSAPDVTTTPSFSLTNLSGVATQMSTVSGNSQSAAVGSNYPGQLVVKAADSSGNGVAGVSVTFTAPASGASATFGPCSGGNPANGCTVTTDSQGDATSSVLTADSSLGTFSVTASASGISPQTFTLTNVVGPASSVASVSGAGQQTLAAAGFGAPLTVTVTDRFGHPVPGAVVTFTAPASGPSAGFAACPGGNPSAHQCVVTTDAGGNASSSLMTAGPAPGAFDVQAAVPAAPSAQFAETVAQSGYWTVASDGGIFSFGGAPFYGSKGGQPLNKPIVGMAVTPEGGYYLVASDGGIFSFGPGATFYGSKGGQPLNKPIVGMAVAPGGGYYLVASDGGLFTFGPGATFQGSMGGQPLNKPIVGMSVDPATGGYWMDASDGGIFAFHAPFYGSKGGSPLNQPMVGMSPSAA